MKKTVLMVLWGALLTSQLVIAQQPREYPLVVRADAPVYPPLARMAKITQPDNSDRSGWGTATLMLAGARPNTTGDGAFGTLLGSIRLNPKCMQRPRCGAAFSPGS